MTHTPDRDLKIARSWLEYKSKMLRWRPRLDKSEWLSHSAKRASFSCCWRWPQRRRLKFSKVIKFSTFNIFGWRIFTCLSCSQWISSRSIQLVVKNVHFDQFDAGILCLELIDAVINLADEFAGWESHKQQERECHKNLHFDSNLKFFLNQRFHLKCLNFSKSCCDHLVWLIQTPIQT